MRELWRRTSSLFWRHPVLWLPVVSADLVVFFVNGLTKVAIRRLVFWLAETHSVLGGADYQTSGRWFAIKTSLLTLPITWTSHFLGILLHTIALLITARILWTILEGAKPALRDSINLSGEVWPSAIWFSVKLLVLNAAADEVFVLLRYPPPATHHIDLSGNSAFMFALSALLSIGIACWMGPAAVRLLRIGGSRQPIQRDPSHARIFAVLASIASLGFAKLAYDATQPLVGSAPHLRLAAFHATEIPIFLFNALATILLYIVLCLIATGDREKTEEFAPEIR